MKESKKKIFKIILIIILIIVHIPIMIIATLFIDYFAFNSIMWNTFFEAPIEVYKQTTDEYVIEYAKKRIYAETGDNVNVEILDKYTVIEVGFIDSSSLVKNNTFKKSNVYKYELKITNAQNPEKSADGYFINSYKNHNNTYVKEKFESEYIYGRNSL